MLLVLIIFGGTGGKGRLHSLLALVCVVGLDPESLDRSSGMTRNILWLLVDNN